MNGIKNNEKKKEIFDPVVFVTKIKMEKSRFSYIQKNIIFFAFGVFYSSFSITLFCCTKSEGKNWLYVSVSPKRQ